MESDDEKGLVDWLLCTYKENVYGTVEVNDVYNQYMKDIGFHLSTQKPVSKGVIGSIIKKIFSHVNSTRLNNAEIKKVQMYRGLSVKKVDVTAFPITINNSIDSVAEIKAMGFFVLPNKSPEITVLGYQHNLKVNRVTVLTEVSIQLDGKISINSLGKPIDLRSVCIGTKVTLTRSGLIGHLAAVTKLIFCTGHKKPYGNGSNKVLRETWEHNSSEETVVYRSSKCDRVLSPAKQILTCKRCQRQEKDFKRMTELQAEEVNVTVPPKPMEAPGSLGSPGSSVCGDPVPAGKSGKKVMTQVTRLLNRLFPGHGQKMSGLKLIIESQIVNHHVKGKRRHRWDPRIIRFCRLLWRTSPQAYEDLRSSGFLILPTVRLLQYYVYGNRKQAFKKTGLDGCKPRQTDLI